MTTELASPIRVLLAEDHDPVRQSIGPLLDGHPDITVVGEAANGLAAIQRCRELCPDVAIIDLSTSETRGLAAVREIRQLAPGVGIVVLMRHDDGSLAQAVFAAGASGYVLKQCPSEQLLEAIRSVAQGIHYTDHALARHPLSRRLGRRSHLRKRPLVSDREKTVLRMVAMGHGNKDIAGILGISVKTVEVHKYNAMFKLALRKRPDVVRYAILHGWMRVDTPDAPPD
jgi:two-component system response regulator NreC